MTFATPPPAPPPSQRPQPSQPAGMGLWVGVLAIILALGIALTLSVGLLVLSYARATAPLEEIDGPAPVATPAPPAVPTVGAPTTDSLAGPALTDRLRDNLGGATSRGVALLVMLALLFFVGQLGLRATAHRAALGVAVGCAWGFAGLAALLGISGALRFTLTDDTPVLEYFSYLALIGINLALAVVLSAVGRLASVCRSFAMLMGIVAVAQLLLTLFGSGLRFDLHFGFNFVYLLILMGAVAVLLYVTGLVEQLYPPS